MWNTWIEQFLMKVENRLEKDLIVRETCYTHRYGGWP